MASQYYNPFMAKDSAQQIKNNNKHEQVSHNHEMIHKQIEVDENSAPTIEISITKDKMAGWNFKVITKNFTFTPDQVNKENILNTGHAHIFIDGVKLTRLYAPHFYLPDFSIGEHDIKVSLNANNHSAYFLKGKEIAATRTIIQSSK